MKIHDVEQNSEAWYALRLGIPTASEFHRIITPSKADFSKQSTKYAYGLIAEAVLRQSLSSISHLEHIERGRLMEPDAVAQYCFVKEAEVKKVGFVTTDDGRMGCSPDRLIVGRRGALEVKCPAAQTHVGYLLEGPGDDYRPQVQGQMLVAELDFVDFYSYHPQMPPVLLTVARDPDYIAKMSSALRQFDELLLTLTERVRQEGYFDARVNVATPVDLLAEQLAQAGAGAQVIDWNAISWQDDLP